MKKLRRSSLSDDAYTFVRALFLSGDRYSPGDKISVEELSRELGVSRTPLWGAIYRLEAEGIVEIVPRLGVYLVDYDPERVIDIYVAREALEGAAARLAAERITQRQIAALKTNIEMQRAHLAEQEIEKYYAAALAFHEEIIGIAGSKTIDRLLRSIFAQIKAMRVQRSYTPMHLPQSCDDHERLLDALQARDPQMAEREARSHIRDLADEIRRVLPEKPSSQRARGRAAAG
ncbi:MAG TPA: GntR family transcriptional regulator [Xanthobacteraceae bacterium]|jgi:DNA-binding GntR family transcriptional regulator